MRSLLLGRDREKQRAEEVRVEMLRLQLELERYKKWYYGPRAVAGALMSAARSNAGRRELTSLQLSPDLLTA